MKDIDPDLKCSPTNLPLGWREIGLFCLFGIHAGLYLLPRLPVTIWRLIQVFKPIGYGIQDKDFFAFGQRDVAFRSWYCKISREQRKVGRFGFVWDDGFGLSMNSRFYNNWLTYILYGWLGTKYYTLGSILAYLAATLILYIFMGDWQLGLLLTVLLLGSPLFLGIQIHLGKPEILWWFLMLPMLVSSYLGNWLVAGLILSLAALANFSVAFLSGISLVILWILCFPGWNSLAHLLLGMFPGLLKTAIRMMPLFRSNFWGSLLHEQLDAVNINKKRFVLRIISPFLLYYCGFYVVALLMITIFNLDQSNFVLFGFGMIALLVYWAGQTLIYLFDPQSGWMWHMSILISLLAIMPSWVGIVGFTIFIYIHPRFSGCPMPSSTLEASGSKRDRLDKIIRFTLSDLSPFPYLEPVSKRALTEPIIHFFQHVPHRARILMEAFSDTRDLGGFRSFLQICEEVLPLRQIELLPDEYVRISDMQFYKYILAAFNSDTSIHGLLEIMHTVGAAFALAHSTDFVYKLKQAEFTPVAVLRPAHLKEQTRRMLHIPDRDLVLLAAPREYCPITPKVDYCIEGNKLFWYAEAGKTYLIRYGYHPNFLAKQGSIKIKIIPAIAAPGTNLRFMRLKAVMSEILSVEFRKSWC